MALSLSLFQLAWKDYSSEVCGVCQKPKRKNQSFCSRCFFELPEDMRKGLYARFGSGYEENYDSARSYLLGERRARGQV